MTEIGSGTQVVGDSEPTVRRRSAAPSSFSSLYLRLARNRKAAA